MNPQMARKMLPSMLLALSASPAAAATPRNILMITVDGASAPAPAAARERSSCALRDCAPARRHSPRPSPPRHMADLRPQLNVAYGMTETITPNLDKFAEGALTFHRAYCQQAVCVAALLLPSCLLPRLGWLCPVPSQRCRSSHRAAA